MTSPDLPGLDPCHDLLIAGADPWVVLAAAAAVFEAEGAELLSVSGAQFADGDCALNVRVRGIDCARAEAAAEAIATRPRVRLSRVEHVLWRARA